MGLGLDFRYRPMRIPTTMTTRLFMPDGSFMLRRRLGGAPNGVNSENPKIMSGSQ